MSGASPHDDAHYWRRLAVWTAVLAAAWALALLAAGAWWAGEQFVSLTRIGWGLWTITFSFLAINHALRFARWHWMLRVEGYAIPLGRSLAVYLAGMALLPTPGKAGLAVRSLLLQRDGVPVNVSLAVHFSERLFDLLGLVALAALVIGSAGEAARWPLAVAGALLATLGAWMAPRACRALTARVRPSGGIHRALTWAQQFFDHAAELITGWRFLPYLALGAAANIATGVLLMWLLAVHGHPTSLASATGIVAVSHLTGSLSMLPGGLGGFEVAMLAQLGNLGVMSGAVLVVLVLIRVATIWGSVAIGLPLLAWQMRGDWNGAGKDT